MRATLRTLLASSNLFRIDLLVVVQSIQIRFALGYRDGWVNLDDFRTGGRKRVLGRGKIDVCKREKNRFGMQLALRNHGCGLMYCCDQILG